MYSVVHVALIETLGDPGNVPEIIHTYVPQSDTAFHCIAINSPLVQSPISPTVSACRMRLRGLGCGVMSTGEDGESEIRWQCFLGPADRWKSERRPHAPCWLFFPSRIPLTRGQMEATSKPSSSTFPKSASLSSQLEQIERSQQFPLPRRGWTSSSTFSYACHPRDPSVARRVTRRRASDLIFLLSLWILFSRATGDHFPCDCEPTNELPRVAVAPRNRSPRQSQADSSRMHPYAPPTRFI